MNMTPEEIYSAEQEYNEYQRLINTVEILTQAEYELCKAWDAEETWKYLNNIGEGRWLNINVYSEAEHHDRIYRMECGL
jgi:hypothetical protein